MKKYLIYSEDISLTMSNFHKGIGYCITVNSNGGSHKVYTKGILEVLKGSVMFLEVVDRQGSEFTLNTLYISDIEKGFILWSVKTGKEYFVSNSLYSKVGFSNDITSSYLLKDITSVLIF